MPKKLTAKNIVRVTPMTIPSGYSIEEFEYRGRPADAQDDFGTDVGIADMVHIDKDGKTASEEYAPDATNKYYHGGVIQSTSDDTWWVYLEWGTAAYTDQSWDNGEFRKEQSAEACRFQFVECDDEDDARIKFEVLMQSKNIDRIQKKKVGNTTIWVCKKKKNSSELETGYRVQKLSSRSRGLPHAYSIIDTKKSKKKKTTRSTKQKSSSSKIHSNVQSLTKDLLAETHGHTRVLMDSAGLIPTLDSIEMTRNDLLPEVTKILKKKRKSKKDRDVLEDLSNNIASLIPRPIPLHGTAKQKAAAIILSPDNIESLEKDMDAFEAMINSDLLTRKTLRNVDVFSHFKSEIEWVDPKSSLGKWVTDLFTNMNRHRANVRIVNVFKITRDRCDSTFLKSVKKVAKKNARKKLDKADAQPSQRPDASDYTTKEYNKANIMMGFHGTPSVNIQPILASNLRMPSWSGCYGAGLYFATDREKSRGYCGGVGNRGTKFIFIHDVIIGKPYMTLSTGNWTAPPSSTDSIFYHHLSSYDEHVIFDPDHQRIRYLIEFK